MKTLYLLRHAKAELQLSTQEDFDRPLAESGREEALLLGKYMAEKRIVLDTVLCSSAQRTQDTYAMLCEGVKAGGGDAAAWQVAYDQEAYLARVGTMMGMAQGFDDAHEHAMIIGHNPGIHQLAVSLAGSGSGDSVQLLKHKFPTCALAVITFDIDAWQEIAPDAGHMRYYRDRHTEMGDPVGRRTMYH